MNHHDPGTMRQLTARVLGQRRLAPDYYLLTLASPEIARHATPGQFAQLRVAPAGTLDPLLARPISIYRVDRAAGAVDFIFKVVGRGTAQLAAIAPGAAITVLGPIGNGFSVPATVTAVALVAGGVGMPPLYFLASELRDRSCDVTLFYGGRTADDLLELPDWEALGVTVVPATDDGSQGYRGLVTAPLQEAIGRQRFDYLAACGPRPMLRAVQQLALAAGIPGQLSLEARMACGVGACLGCICATVTGNQRVCVDGPVFTLEEVVFDA